MEWMGEHALIHYQEDHTFIRWLPSRKKTRSKTYPCLHQIYLDDIPNGFSG